MATPYLVPAVAAAAILAVGAAAGGAFIGKGVENARVGARNATVRGVSEREVKVSLIPNVAIRTLCSAEWSVKPPFGCF